MQLFNSVHQTQQPVSNIKDEQPKALRTVRNQWRWLEAPATVFASLTTLKLLSLWLAAQAWSESTSGTFRKHTNTPVMSKVQPSLRTVRNSNKCRRTMAGNSHSLQAKDKPCRAQCWPAAKAQVSLAPSTPTRFKGNDDTMGKGKGKGERWDGRLAGVRKQSKVGGWSVEFNYRPAGLPHSCRPSLMSASVRSLTGQSPRRERVQGIGKECGEDV